jgi:[acyl-carrier-protein] S-malonyltransferase
VDFDVAQSIAEEAAEGEVCTAANDNDPSQVVTPATAGGRARSIAREPGLKRALLLPVSAPFHRR